MLQLKSPRKAFLLRPWMSKLRRSLRLHLLAHPPSSSVWPTATHKHYKAFSAQQDPVTMRHEPR